MTRIQGMSKKDAENFNPTHIKIMNIILNYCPVQLFIFVEPESNAPKPKIFVYYTKNKYPPLHKNEVAKTFFEECAQSKEIDNKTAISDFKKYLSKNIKRIKEREVIKRGKGFYDDLIPNNIKIKLNEELQNDNAKKYSFSWGKVPINDDDTKLKQFLTNKCNVDWVNDAEIRKSKDGKILSVFKDENSAEIMIDEVKEKVNIEIYKNNKILICCKDEDIDYVWEWIFWRDTHHFPMGKKGKDFFWGDEFHIVRIPKEEDWEDFYLFCFSVIEHNKEQQEKLLKHLHAINTSLFHLIENAKYVPDKDKRINIIKNGNTIATLEIENDLCYFKRENGTKIKIGVVRAENGKLKIYRDLNFKIANIAILRDSDCHRASKDIEYLESKANYHEPINLESDRLKNLHAFDGIYVVGNTDKTIYIKSIETALSDIKIDLRNKNPLNVNITKYLFSFSEIVNNEKQQNELLKHLQTISPDQTQQIENTEYSSDGDNGINIIKNGNTIATLEIENDLCYFKQGNGRKIKIGIVRREDGKLNIYATNSPCFLFLNTCGCSTIQSQMRELTNLISVKMWIDTSFLEVPESFASKFSRAFYEEFYGTGKNVVEAVTHARRKIKDQNNDKFLKYVYIVRGNPCTNVTSC
jgi:hypothetical protein